jgi:hypothetical protein
MKAPNTMEEAMIRVRDLLRPFEVAPFEWIRMPMDKSRSRYGVAMVVSLTTSACTPSVLTGLISGIAEKLVKAFDQESLVALQITFGKPEGNEIKRCYRINIPANLLKDAANLECLPESTHQTSAEIQGFWFRSQ